MEEDKNLGQFDFSVLMSFQSALMCMMLLYMMSAKSNLELQL